MKSGQTPRLSDHPLIVIIGTIGAIATIAATCISVFIFLTGVQFVTQLFVPKDNSSSPTNLPTTVVQSPPASFHLNVGESVEPAEGWVWVCTGDFACASASGTKFEYFDDLSRTGLVVVLGPESRMTLSGPSNMPRGHSVGDCLPFSLDEKERGVSEAVSSQLLAGCGSRCLSVRIVEIGKEGRVVADYWKP